MDHQFQAWLANVLQPIEVAMQYGQYQEALFYLDRAFTFIPKSIPPNIVGTLLLHSAECNWHLNSHARCLNELGKAHHLVVPNPSDTKKMFDKWIQRTEQLLDLNSSCSEGFAKFCWNFLAKNITGEAQCCLLLGVISSEEEMIMQAMLMDRNIFEEYLGRWKSAGIQALHKKDNVKALKLLQRALMLIVDKNRHTDAQRSILSHLATVHFRLKQYKYALRAGQELYGLRSESVDEANRLKERGKKVFQEKDFGLCAEFYTLAMLFTPRGAVHNELFSTLFANRSAAYCKLEKFQEALDDGRQSVGKNPTSSKAHYRLGKSFVGLKQYQNGCEAYSNALHLAEDYQNKIDITLQIVNAAQNIPSGLEGVDVVIPTILVQDLINRFVEKRDWEKLGFLFLGGGGSPMYRYGQGGLATHRCDASKVPLELIVQCRIKSVNLPKLIEALIKNGAPFQGSPSCQESPLKIASRLNDKNLLDVLLKYDKSRAVHWLENGKKEFEKKNFQRAINLLSMAVQGELNSLQLLTAYNLLSDSYYEVKEYDKCIEYGHKSFRKNPNEELAKKWKNRGNELNAFKLYSLMSDFYSLALKYAPSACVVMRAAIHSNRSMAYVNCQRLPEAKDDAQCCIKLRDTWFRGYSRLGACWAAEKKYSVAISTYCRGLNAVKTDVEKSSLLNEILETCVKLPEQVTITIPIQIPVKLMNSVVKQAVKDKAVTKLKTLFVDKRYQLPGSSELNCLGSFSDCVSCVPLEMILESTIRDKDILIEELLLRGASPSGSHNCSHLPIHLAMQQRDYKTAVTLLRHGADPHLLLENKRESFDPRAPHLSQWINIGHKAFMKNAFSKAEIYYSLALEYPEAARDKSAQCQAFKALSDIYFEQGRYKECLAKGRECVKMSPHKSEDEAQKWQKRSIILTYKESQDTTMIVPSYITHAMNYAPPSSEKLRFDLLCLRSDAYLKIQDCQQAIEDGNNAIKIKPKEIRGYKCLVNCYKKLERPSKTFIALANCFKAENINPDEKHKYLVKALNIAINLPEGTTRLQFEVPPSSLQQLHDESLQSGNWAMIRLLYLGGGGPQKYEIRKGGLGTNSIHSENVPVEDIVSANFSFKSETVAAVIDHGANVDGLRGNANPLEIAASKKDFEVIKVLIDHGANPSAKSDGFPLLHKEVKKAIDTGDLEVLQTLLSSTHPDVKNAQDSNGNTPYHQVMSGRKNVWKCKVLRCLINAEINPILVNKQGKKPIECCNKRDDRNIMLKKFIREYVPKPAEEKKTVKVEVFDNSNNVQSTPNDTWEEKDAKDISSTTFDKMVSTEEPKSPISKPKVDTIKRKEKRKEDEQRYILYLIERLDVDQIKTIQEEEHYIEITSSNIDTLQSNVPVFEEKHTQDHDDYEDEEEQNATSTREEVDIEDLTSPFENLTWEVDCTESVWKTMRSRKVQEQTKEQIVQKIRMLAEGRWGTRLCKRLEGEPKEKGILLYESRITKGSRIIWEKTIAFSARCSNDPKLRLTTGNQGLIYSDIIRVWDIVLDHKDLNHSIQNIVKSHERGSQCIIKAELKGMKSMKGDKGQLKFPSYYQERKPIQKDQPTVLQKKDVFFPPASSEKNEYHILKFYSFTSALINTLLDSDQKSKIDFPFKVTELEHAIINLKTDKPRAIILLGRSGTGKTTCCLYRLWTEFQVYWDKAITAGPHIPKYVPNEMTRSGDDQEDRKDQASFVPTTDCQFQQTPVNYHGYTSEPCTSKQVDLSCQLNDSKEVEKAEDNSPGHYEHLHQVFITKNNVLCSEVQKNFQELKNACPETKHLATTDDSTPNVISDINEEAWPLFIGSHDWLLLLDASLPGTAFFEREKDGSLLINIEGWGKEDSHLHFIPDDDDDEDDELGEREGYEGATPANAEQQALKSNRGNSNRREVTYQVFINELWPKMKKAVKNDFHPTLVWTEIRSFIKGSAESLSTETGYLSCEEYENLGQKRAPNFMGDRFTVYQLFKIYQNIIRSSRKMFDEADLVYNLHQRLMAKQEVEWSIHNIYVDETQDFTQAELYLLILCCRFPNRMFFTGDTAQSIMRGIAFRFEDLKTLFHAIQASNLMKSKSEPVRVPHRPYQLTHNYRSHAGILELASSIVNLLQTYFPESFDRLEKDCGLFEGPKPILLESCSITDLAMIMRGNRRQASRIEFGAHQAVLVVSDEARERMPDELKYGLVLTIYEAKGLEFDDVLIYNFFKDSHARKEWRVVTSYMEKICADSCNNVTGIFEMQEEDINLRSRPLEFNPEKHKVLNSELKFLYTAITRARVNVWFFDEDEENRAPMFEFFQRLNLVRSITLDDQEGGTNALTSMFAEESTECEWRDQGHFFYNKRVWHVAEKCFMLGNDESMVRKCQAQEQAQEALQNQSNSKIMKEMFFTAAKLFLECGMLEEAEICLYNCREKMLLANLYKKMKRFEEASKIFHAEKSYDEASQCMEEINDYNLAIEIFCDGNLYEKAIRVLERYNTLNVDRAFLENEAIIPPKPNRTIERLCYKLAENYFNQDKRHEMEDVLQRLPPGDRISFFKKHNCIEEAARALVEDEQEGEAASFLKLHGHFKEAMNYSEDPKFLADCNLFEARQLIRSKKAVKMETENLLKDALKYYKKCSDKSGEGEAMLLLGKQYNNISYIKEAGKAFANNNDVCGETEVVIEMLERDENDPFYYRIIVRSIERLLELIVNLHKPYTQLKADKQTAIARCEKYFGLNTTPDQNVRRYFTGTAERFKDLLASLDMNDLRSAGIQKDIDVKSAYNIISCHLVDKATTLVHKTTSFLKSKLQLTELAALSERFEILFNWVYLDGVVSKFKNELKHFKASQVSQQSLENLPTVESKEYMSCRCLYKLMFPEAGPCPLQLSREDILRIRTHHAVKAMLISFCECLRNKSKSNVCSIDDLLQISYLMQILDMKDQMRQFLKEKEQSFQNNVTNKQQLMYESGMLKLSDHSFEIFFRQWERGKKNLHVYGDVVTSLHLTCRRFLTYAAKNRALDYPSIVNTVMILEHQLTVALLILSRLNIGVLFCIPESYLSRLRFIDEINCTHPKHYSSHQAVDEFVRKLNRKDEHKCQRDVLSLFTQIVKLMFGGITKLFNVYQDTFSSSETEQLVLSGVAERVIVLSLTMLVNCGHSKECQEVILENVFSVTLPSSLPGYVKDAFLKLNDLNTLGDVLEVLNEIMGAKSGGKLFDFNWRELVLGKLKTAQPSNHILMLEADISRIKHSISQNKWTRSLRQSLSEEEKEKEKEAFEAQDDFESEVIMKVADDERQKELQEEQVRSNAAIQIQKWLRKCWQRIKSVKKEIEDHEALPKVERFSRFKIDSSACTICGASFTSEESSLSPEDHSVDDLHKATVLEFQEYKTFYCESVQPVLSKSQCLQKEVDKNLDMDADMEKLNEMSQKAWDIVQDIESNRKWKNIKGLKHLVQNIEKCVLEIEVVNTGDRKSGTGTGNDEVFENEDEEIVPKPLPTAKSQGQARKRKTGRKKSNR